MSIELRGNTPYSVALARELHRNAVDHLLRHQRIGELQEDLCFGLWRPSRGSQRTTALVHKLILPERHEARLNGNVSFTPAYLERVSDEARRTGSGLLLMHSHFGPGWQAMSHDDVAAEQTRAAYVLAATALPFVGMTLGTDGAWSARFWLRVAPRQYERRWCENVRVVGKKLEVTFHPTLSPTPRTRDTQIRTVSAWGPANQAQLARLHVGVVGLGSVGRLVVECLARIGIQHVTLIDFDRLFRKNLDRQIGAFLEDADGTRLKVDLAKSGFLRAATAANPRADALPAAVTEPDGFHAALNCDAIFCCVDRPWGRRVLNHLAYAHLIPIVDGGIVVRTSDNAFRGAEWSCRTAGPERRCLACAGAYDPGLVDDERRGLLDDPSYFDLLPADLKARASQNVLPFSMSLAAHEVIQFIALVTGMLDMADLGDQRFHYNLREVLTEDCACGDDCEFPSVTATGDSEYSAAVLTGVHPAAEQIRRTSSAANCRSS